MIKQSEQRKGLELRERIEAIMEAHDGNISEWCHRANISPSAIYNLGKTSSTMSVATLKRLFDANGVDITEVFLPQNAKHIDVIYSVGDLGRMFFVELKTLPRPSTVDAKADVYAIEIDQGALPPFTAGWYAVAERTKRQPSECVGQLCVVKVKGKPEPVIRHVHRGSASKFVLRDWTGGITDDVAVDWCNRILSFHQP